MREPQELARHITTSIRRIVAEASTATAYRLPLVGFAPADDPGFKELRRIVGRQHRLPRHLLPGARSVVSFFLPFAPWVVEANAGDRDQVAPEWAVAYVETNALIATINERLITSLGEEDIRAVSEPATHNYDPETLVSSWSHKSVAVIAGLGTFGLHHMVITDAGCAGRFGSIILDAELPIEPPEFKQRCLYFYDASCLECITRCPVGALEPDVALDRHRCNRRLEEVAHQYEQLGRAPVCGKCVLGPCAFKSAVD